MIDRMEQNQEIVTRYFNDGAFGTTLFKALVRRVYDEHGGAPWRSHGRLGRIPWSEPRSLERVNA